METNASINADGQDDACFDENFGNIVVHEDSKIYPDAIMVQIKHRKWQYGFTILSSNDYVLEKDKRTVFHYYDSPTDYSIVKDSSADLGVNFKIVQNRPTVKAVCTKISKKFFCIFVNILMFLRENKEASFFLF
jgi:hypothetical protein